MSFSLEKTPLLLGMTVRREVRLSRDTFRLLLCETPKLFPRMSRLFLVLDQENSEKWTKKASPGANLGVRLLG